MKDTISNTLKRNLYYVFGLKITRYISAQILGETPLHASRSSWSARLCFIQGVPKEWDPLRNLRRKSRRSTIFWDCINNNSAYFFEHNKGPGPIERPQMVGAITTIITTIIITITTIAIFCYSYNFCPLDSLLKESVQTRVILVIYLFLIFPYFYVVTL